MFHRTEGLPIKLGPSVRAALLVIVVAAGLLGLCTLYALGQKWAHGERVSITFQNDGDRNVVLFPGLVDERVLRPGKSVTIGFEDTEWQAGEPHQVLILDEESRRPVYSEVLTREDLKERDFRIVVGRETEQRSR